MNLPVLNISYKCNHEVVFNDSNVFFKSLSICNVYQCFISFFLFCVFVCIFETRSPCVVRAGLELTMYPQAGFELVSILTLGLPVSTTSVVGIIFTQSIAKL